MFVFNCSQIQLAEFDLGGVLYHARYFHLFERAREAFLQSADYPYPQLVQDGFHFVIAESHQKFLKPLYYGDSPTIELSFSKLKRTSVIWHYRLMVEAREIHKAWTKSAFVENVDGRFRSSQIPQRIRGQMAAHLSENP